MRVAVIVSPPFSWEIVVKKLRLAGFTEPLDLFVQPGTPVTTSPTAADNLLIRRLTTGHTYPQLVKQIVRWWSLLPGSEQFLCLLDGSCDFDDQTAAKVRLAAAAPVDWGLFSLYTPLSLAQYYVDCEPGWNSLYTPVPLIACCFSRRASQILANDPKFCLEAAGQDVSRVVIDALSQRSLVQAAHYPTLIYPTVTSQTTEPGLLLKVEKDVVVSSLVC